MWKMDVRAQVSRIQTTGSSSQCAERPPNYLLGYVLQWNSRRPELQSSACAFKCLGNAT